ncbi:MAG TPA: RDD family protein [Polyangiaceae bacterium]
MSRGTTDLAASASATEPLDTDIAIETPEHIVFRHRVAGPVRRAFAYFVDLMICYGSIFIVAVVVLLFAKGFEQTGEALGGFAGAGMGVILILMFCAEWVYFVAWEATAGRSPGKMLCGLFVVTSEGRPIGFSQSMLRNVVRAADMLPFAYLVGVIAMTCTKRFQRLGDLVAGTMVVVGNRGAGRAQPIVLLPPATAEELAAFPSVVRLDAEERAAIELFLRRKHTLGVAREHELAEMLVEPLGKRYDFTRRDPSRVLALLYDLAMNAGRNDGPPSSRTSAPPPRPGGGPAWR